MTLAQQLYMEAPYSKELRALHRFASKHPDSAFGQAMQAKAELFNLQQTEFRPQCRLSRAMYSLERLLGRCLSASTLTVAFTLFTVLGAAYLVSHSRTFAALTSWGSNSNQLDSLLESYLLKVEKQAINSVSTSGRGTAPDVPHDSRFREQLKESLQDPATLKFLRELLANSSTPEVGKVAEQSENQTAVSDDQ